MASSDQQLRLSLAEEATCPLTLGPPLMAGPLDKDQQLLLSLAEEATCPLTLGPPRAPMAGPPEQDQRWLSLAEEATCPICLGYFAEPVSVQCGHTFCTPCITRYWEGVQDGQGPYPCPHCRETAPTNTLVPNRHLASIVQILAQGPPVAPPKEGPRGEFHIRCTEHDEKLKLFCQQDLIPICVICRESREHQDHKVRPVREAAREYKDKFRSYADNIRKKLENILELQHKEETKLTDLEKNFKIQRERITSVFNKVQQFLENEKCRHLSNLEEKEKMNLQRIRETVLKLIEQQTSFNSLITEMESKCQQVDVDLLKDVKRMMSRYEDLNTSHTHSEPSNGHEKQSDKEEGSVKEKEEVKVVEEEEDLVKKIIESLEWRYARSFAGEVTLDPDTAHWWLILSEDGKSVRDGDRAQDLPDTPERFNSVGIVLGRERLSSGRHYWEVEVGDKTRWSLGVCDESVSRKGVITLAPERGYWAVWLRDGEYQACTSPSTPLTPRVPPRVVGLFLDYEVGRLSVYNVTDRSLLFTFSGASFPRTLRPFFCPELRDGGRNVAALRVLPVTGWD